MLFVFDLIGQSTALVPYGSTWKYLDNGKNQGSTWRNISFNDAAWKSGLAQLGYGDGDEATVVSFGGNANKKYITTYFRKTISIGDASGFSSYTLNIKRDDGAVVYINGTEVFRTNMPAGSVSFSTKALDATDDGNTPQSKSLGAGTLVTGTNVIAVEIHQVSATSTDISFDLELFGNTGAAPCNPPTGLNTSGITTTGSTIAWTSVSGAISYDADYKANSSSTWINAATGTTSTSLNLSGLTASTLYDWRVRTNCTSSSSTYSTSQFTTASTPSQPTVTRGPYLQMGNETAITIRWRTNIASDSRVQIGTTPASNDVTTVSDGSAVTEHEIRVTGLSSDTKYYYTIGTTTGTIQGDANNYFQTAPSANTTRKIRIAAFGDCGTNSLNHQSGTLTAYRNYLTNNALEAADAWLLLGDNAYSNGTDAEYSSNFFNPYGSNILKNHKLYPSPGNHDYAQSSSRQADHNVPYFNMFTLPANAECG